MRAPGGIWRRPLCGGGRERMNRGRYHVLDALARKFLRPRETTGAVVVYTPGHLGDVLHAVPMLKRLRQGLPGRRILWVVGPWSAPLAGRYPEWADEIVEFAPGAFASYRGARTWRQWLARQWRLGHAIAVVAHFQHDFVALVARNRYSRRRARRTVPQRIVQQVAQQQLHAGAIQIE